MTYSLPNQPTLEEHMKNLIPKTLNIGFGAMVPSISSQLKQQGYKYNKSTVKHFEKLSESILYLHFACIITDSQSGKLKHKLFKQIQKHVKECNK